MSSRDKILSAVQLNQALLQPEPAEYVSSLQDASVEAFTKVLESIGGAVYAIEDYATVPAKIKTLFPGAVNIMATVEGVQEYFTPFSETATGQSFETIEVAIMEAAFGVAENGAVWLTEAQSKYRVLPFIAEHLVVLLKADAIVATMHHAYQMIGNAGYDFGVFIAGPSKTADIEQSLVLGAHGPKSMTVFLV